MSPGPPVPPGPQVRRDRWSAAGLAVLALAYLTANRAYALDTLATPGPGLFPLATGLVLLVLAVWQFVTPGSHRGPSGAAASAGSGAVARASLVMAAVLIAYAAALPVAGFLPASFALVVVAARLMGARGWWGPAALAAGVCAVSHVLFVLWLGVPLPAGRLGW